MQIYDLSRQDLESLFQELSIPKIHVQAFLRSAYKYGTPKPWRSDGLPKKLMDYGDEHWRTDAVQAAKIRQSRYDSTVKFLTGLKDGSFVETVLMPEKGRITLCISSQVGCAQACAFCHTGRMGLKRQMSPAEIVGQVVMANQWLAAHPEWGQVWGYPLNCRVSNVVFMGMGEPLDNVSAVKQALKIMIDQCGLNLSLRRISVSTAGHLPGLHDLLEDFPSVSLALSLHATGTAERSRLMPINRKWPIDELLAFLRQHYAKQGRRQHLLIQYTVIKGVNDSPRHAAEMLELLEGLPVKVNLIPLNDIARLKLKAPRPEGLESFRDLLHHGGLRVMIRYSKGQDIEAACGQLAVDA